MGYNIARLSQVEAHKIYLPRRPPFYLKYAIIVIQLNLLVLGSVGLEGVQILEFSPNLGNNIFLEYMILLLLPVRFKTFMI